MNTLRNQVRITLQIIFLYNNMNRREKSIGIIKKKYECIRGWLNEKSRRIWAATEAEVLFPRIGAADR